MTIHLLHTDVRMNPEAAVDMVYAVDNVPIRITIDVAQIRRQLGHDLVAETALRDYLWTHRNTIQTSIMAHFYAHGFPLERHLTIALAELMGLSWAELVQRLGSAQNPDQSEATDSADHHVAHH